jgi:hypothetical protein
MPHDSNGKKCKRKYTTGERGGEGGLFSLHTDAAGRNVCSHHDRTLAGLEFVQDPVTFVLLLVTVNCWNTLA